MNAIIPEHEYSKYDTGMFLLYQYRFPYIYRHCQQHIHLQVKDTLRNVQDQADIVGCVYVNVFK